MSTAGVVYVNTWSGRYYGNSQPHEGGFLVALKDTHGTGKADVNQRFGETVATGGTGGTVWCACQAGACTTTCATGTCRRGFCEAK